MLISTDNMKILNVLAGIQRYFKEYFLLVDEIYILMVLHNSQPIYTCS